MVGRQPSITRSSGFIPLGGGGSTRDMSENGIPLTTVRSYASTTGARKPNKSASFESSSNEKEKSASGFQPHHHGRRRKVTEGSLARRGTGDGEGAHLNAMGKMYAKLVGFSAITRYVVYITPVALLLAAPLIVLPLTDHEYDILVGGSFDKDGNNPNHYPTLFNLFLWIEVTWLTLWAGKLVAWFIPQTFMFFCGIVSVGTRKYATVLSNLSIPLALFFWALATWVTFQRLFKDANDNGVKWVQDIVALLGATFVSSVVFLIEKALVQLIGVSYHQRSFANRIKASKHEIYLLGLLYDASRTLFPMYSPDFADEDYIIDDSIEMLLRSGSGGHVTGAATPMKLVGDVGRFGGKVTSAFGTIAHEITGKKVFNPNSAHSIVIEALEKLGPTEALARRIWMSFVVEGKEALFLDDVQEVLGPAYKVEAEEAFYAVDSDSNGDISLDEMVRKVVEIAKERKAISEGMKDIGQALGSFDQVLLFVVFLIVIFIFLAFFHSSVLTIVASAGTTLLSLSFIFAVTCQEFLGSCIFLFVKHPYDVGDKVQLTDASLVVERISLLYSVFLRTDTSQVVQIPNIVLNTLWVDNITRSKAMSESFEVDVSYDTSFEDIELLRLEMEKFVRHPDNSRDFQSDFTIGVSGVGNLDKLQLGVTIKHKSNWHNGVVRATRRSKFMCALALALKKVPINGPGGGGDALGGPANPTYSVSVTDDFAAEKRSASAQTKEAARMIPTKKPEDEQEAMAGERQAAAELNTRPVVPETVGQWGLQDDRMVRPQDSTDAMQREQDIDAVRNDLLKRESTRGRRRAGVGLPALDSTVSMGGASLSPTASGNARSPRLGAFDEEAQMESGAYYRSNRSDNLVPHPYPAAGVSGTQRSGSGALQGSASQRSQMSQRSRQQEWDQ